MPYIQTHLRRTIYRQLYDADGMEFRVIDLDGLVSLGLGNIGNLVYALTLVCFYWLYGDHMKARVPRFKEYNAVSGALLATIHEIDRKLDPHEDEARSKTGPVDTGEDYGEA